MSGLPANFPTATTAQLVSAACVLKQQISAAADDLAKIEARLIATGAGRHVGLEEGEGVTVVKASIGKDKITLAAEDEASARNIAGRAFGQVFDRVVIRKPCKGFVEILPKLLTPGRVKKLLALCANPTKGKPSHCANYSFAAAAV